MGEGELGEGKHPPLNTSQFSLTPPHTIPADLIVVEQETVMGTIGNRTEEGDNRFVAIENLFRSFYLNDNAPANASGTVSSMQYCYTLDTDRLDRIEIFLSTVGFYRPVGSNYTLVNSTVITVENSPNQFPPNITDVFQCLEVDVPEFEVEKGDVIGVCVRRYSGTSNAALRVERVNTVAESNGSSVLRSRGIENENFCTEMGVMPGTFASGQLRRVDDRAIRVSAQISKSLPSVIVFTMEPPIKFEVQTLSNQPPNKDNLSYIANNIGFITFQRRTTSPILLII